MPTYERIGKTRKLRRKSRLPLGAPDCFPARSSLRLSGAGLEIIADLNSDYLRLKSAFCSEYGPKRA